MPELKFSVIAALAAGLALSACATTSSTDSAAGGAGAASASVGERDLSPQEKKVIVDAISPSLRNPSAAKYKWNKFPAIVTEDTVNYCGTVDAASPFPAYNGRQAYIVEAHMAGGHVAGAVMGLIAGGKDFAIVTKMCAKYGLDPAKAT